MVAQHFPIERVRPGTYEVVRTGGDLWTFWGQKTIGSIRDPFLGVEGWDDQWKKGKNFGATGNR
jgi:hypothetical protein